MNMKYQPLLVAASAVVLAACARNEAATTGAMPAPQVNVAPVLAQNITEFDEFTGRIQAVERVEVRPRVSGYIASVNFAEGREVRQGDVLFVIDPRPYEADLKRAQADLAQSQTAKQLAATEHERASKLLSLRAISQEEYDTRVAGNEQAAANVQAAQAAVDTAQLNLTFTQVKAPISGLISKAEVTAGNLVSSGNTLLTTLVSINPVYVEFQGDEQMYLKYARELRSNRVTKPVWVGLADETDYPHQGALVFMDNQLDAATGTVRVRGKLDNSERHYTPGMFARVKISVGGEQLALLVRDSAIGTDQSIRYVYVVNTDNKVEYRPITLGSMANGLRVVKDGLKAGEQVVVDGLQRIRPGVAVSTQQVSMQQSTNTTAALASNSASHSARNSLGHTKAGATL